MAMGRQGNRRGFTLIELLVVIAIILMLTAFLALAIPRMRTRARIAGLNALFDKISIAMDKYHHAFNAYLPAGDFHTLWDGSGAADLEEGAWRTYSGEVIYPVKDRRELPLDGNNLIDPWGNVITYTRVAAGGGVAEHYTMESNGPDGVNGNSDDITWSSMGGN